MVSNNQRTFDEGSGIGVAVWDHRSARVRYSYRLTQELVTSAQVGGRSTQVEGLKSGHGTLVAEPFDAVDMALANDVELELEDGRRLPILLRRQTGDLVQWVLRGAPKAAGADEASGPLPASK